MIKKPFEKVLPGDQIYMLKPLTIQILSATVIKSAVHPKSQNKFVWALEFYKPTELPFEDETLRMAKENFGAATTMQVIVPKDANLIMVVIRPLPTMICTEENTLTEWLDKADKETLELLTQMRGKI